MSEKAAAYKKLFAVRREMAQADDSMLASEHASENPRASEVASNLASEQSSLLASEQSSPVADVKRVRRVQWNTRISKQLAEKVEIWCFVNKVSKQDATERALASMLASEHATKLARIDIDSNDGSTEDDMLIFYRRWTGNRVTDRDREALKEVEQYHPNIIKAGILITITRAKNRINSFRYCVGAIEEAAASPVKPDGDYIKYLLGKVGEGK